jgi:hypothetical protein
LVKNTSNGIKIVGPGNLTKNIKFIDVKLTKKLHQQVINLKSKTVEKPKKEISIKKKATPKKSTKKL